MVAKLHQSHLTGSRDIQNGLILPGLTSYVSFEASPYGEHLTQAHVLETPDNIDPNLSVLLSTHL